jgi:acetate kinase
VPRMAPSFVLTLNGGSSSLKAALYDAADPPAKLTAVHVERIGLPGEVSDHAAALERVIAALEAFGGLAAVSAVGHRIVHGGDFDGPRRLDDGVLAELQRLASLDPDHLPAELALVRAVTARAPGVPQIACFDTSFHRTMPRVARLVALPHVFEERGVRRYGFHGLSYEFLAGALAREIGDARARGRVILAHLGSGASLCALRDGRSVETTMGFTPTGGVPMGTRSGDLDPGVLVHILRSERMNVDALDELVNRRAGLAGLSGGSPDMRDLLAREETDTHAADAIAVFCHGIKKAIGAFAAVLGGVDALVFSAGIGERSAVVRARILQGLEHLGMHLDPAANDRHTSVISTKTSPCTVLVLRTDEESMIVQETRRILRGTP